LERNILDDREQQPGSALSKRTTLLIAGIGLTMAAGVIGAKMLSQDVPAQASVRAAQVRRSEKQPADVTQVADETVQRLKHPAHGYVLITAYFELHQTGADMSMDVHQAIAAAAGEFKKQRGLGFVVTCHGADALIGGVDVTEEELASARFQTIRSSLTAEGVPSPRIASSWGDPSLARAAEKLGGPMESEHPTCYIETAVHT
jgi:hypothetical protein